mgnify:CR=1 FL=1
MEFKLFQYVLPLAMFVSCSDSSEVIPDVPEKLTFAKYEIACFEPSTKKDPVDTLFVSPMAAVSDFDVTIRRQVLSDGVFKGTYEYVPCSEVGVTVSNKDFSVELKEGSNMQTSSLSLTAPANMDYENAVLSSVSSIPPPVLWLPVLLHSDALSASRSSVNTDILPVCALSETVSATFHIFHMSVLPH